MKRIACITLYDNINIGNKLQNYAVQYLCEDFGLDCTTIPYSEAQNVYRDMSWKGKVIAAIGLPSAKAIEKQLLIRRRKNFERFSRMHLKTQKSISFASAKQKLTGRYDAFIVGSDQVWHNWTHNKKELHFFFLQFAPENQRICIAPSFGMNLIPSSEQTLYREGLRGFKYLSCREKDGCEMIEAMTGRAAVQLVDPTLMLTAAQWNQIARKPDFELPEKYILVYFLSEMSVQAREYIDSVAAYHNCQVVDIFSKQAREYYHTAPDEFLYIMSHAFYVITNSFHGSVFSILYRKPFSLFPRVDGEGTTMSSRLCSILEMLDLEECLEYRQMKIPYIDYKKVEVVLTRERIKERAYLNQAFEAALE